MPEGKRARSELLFLAVTFPAPFVASTSAKLFHAEGPGYDLGIDSVAAVVVQTAHLDVNIRAVGAT